MSKDTFHDTTNATVGEKIVYHYPTMFNSDQAFWIRTINEYFKKELKSTPIPIQTPCVELEKEVERLKGLLREFHDSGWRSGYSLRIEMNDSWEGLKSIYGPVE